MITDVPIFYALPTEIRRLADRYDPLGSGIKEATTGKRNCSNITTCFCIGVTWLPEAPAFRRIQRGPVGGQHPIEISSFESPSPPPHVAKGGPGDEHSWAYQDGLHSLPILRSGPTKSPDPPGFSFSSSGNTGVHPDSIPDRSSHSAGRRHSVARSSVDLYRLTCQTKGARMPRLTPARCSVQIGQTESAWQALRPRAHLAPLGNFRCTASAVRQLSKGQRG